MEVSYQWLIELTGVTWSVEEMARRLTLCGTACEGITPFARHMDRVVVGEVCAVAPIAGADKLRRATVAIGAETLDLVCGAPNVAAGQKVPVALLGAKLAGEVEVRRATIRGVESLGMICSERELGLSDDHSGIMVLEPEMPVGAPLAEALDAADYRMTFELTPNRPDSMSAIGIARDIAALARVRLRRPAVRLRETAEKAADVISVRLDDPAACPRYAARVIRNVTLGRSPWWIRRRLMMSGVRPINNVVDVTNLVMLECGHPLHAFDLDRFGSREVVVRRAREGERFTTLDGKTHVCDPQVLLITNGAVGVAAAGVMGGENSEVAETTRNILLEAAYFDPPTIRKSRRALATQSESSQRFEKGVDPNGIEYAIDRAAALLADLGGGEVLAGMVDAYPRRIDPKAIALRPRRCNDVLGTDLTAAQMKEILEGLEFAVEDGDPLRVTVPTFRPDVEREIDLIEEVVRILGFDRVEDARSTIGPLFTPLHFEDTFKDQVRQVLTGAGFDEVLSHGLADSHLADLAAPELPQLRLVSTASAELNIMRNSMILSAVPILGHNVARRNVDLRIFEIGKVYFPPTPAGEWIEDERILLAVTGDTPHTWREKPRPHDFYDVKAGLERLAEHFHWPALEFVPQAVSFLEPGASFRLRVRETEIGAIGQLSVKLARQADIKQAVWLAEVATGPLLPLSSRVAAYEPLPIYPAAPRDLALVVDETVPAGDIVGAIRTAAGELAEDVSIFDLYTGKQIEAGKKSIAVAISYRSKERSLSSEEVEAAQQKVVAAVKKLFNAEVRDK